MANYKESQVSGTSWVRANEIIIGNPYEGMPQIHFREEEVLLVGDKTMRQPVAGMVFKPLTASFAEPATQFNLVHPDTDAVIGSSTYQDVQVLLYSLYRHLANIRDTSVVV